MSSKKRPSVRKKNPPARVELRSIVKDPPQSATPRALFGKTVGPAETPDDHGLDALSLAKTMEDVEDEFTCPISLALTIDPVIAEDGRVYERAAIEEWFSRLSQDIVKSPMTNMPMGKRLTPATQTRNLMEIMVVSGRIVGPKADAWKQGIANLAQVNRLLERANAGCSHSMGRLGFSYRDGTRGVRKDPKTAFMWFKRAADLRDPPAATSCGVCYINGSGVTRSHTRGICMVTIAATLGSEHACSILGWANAEGHHGFDKDPAEATRWYREMQKCGVRDSVDIYRDRATAWLLAYP